VNGEYIFAIAGRDEDEAINVVLREKLKRHHSLELPDHVSLVATDEHTSYDGLQAHESTRNTVSHSTGEYVRGQIHTNNIDRSGRCQAPHRCTYHNVSKKYCRCTWRSSNFATTIAKTSIRSGRS
jgi:hypothetical protein